MLGHTAAAQTAHSRLHEAAQIAGRPMVHAENRIELFVEDDDHARTHLCCLNHETKLLKSVLIGATGSIFEYSRNCRANLVYTGDYRTIQSNAIIKNWGCTVSTGRAGLSRCYRTFPV